MATRIVEPFADKLTKTSKIREWFERYEFYLKASDLREVAAEDATELVKTAAEEKKHSDVYNLC